MPRGPRNKNYHHGTRARKTISMMVLGTEVRIVVYVDPLSCSEPGALCLGVQGFGFGALGLELPFRGLGLRRPLGLNAILHGMRRP